MQAKINISRRTKGEFCHKKPRHVKVRTLWRAMVADCHGCIIVINGYGIPQVSSFRSCAYPKWNARVEVYTCM